MRLVLIFGTFNPITKAHIHMGELAKNFVAADKVIYIPSRNNFLKSWKKMKGKDILDGKIRVKLMQEAFEKYGFIVDDMEISTDISGKTFDSVCAIKEKYTTDDIYICMGTDKIEEFDTWYKAEELFSENNFIIISRDKIDLSQVINLSKIARENSDKFHAMENDMYDSVSASMIRKAYIENHLDEVRKFIPENVYEYLNTHKKVFF